MLLHPKTTFSLMRSSVPFFLAKLVAAAPTKRVLTRMEYKPPVRDMRSSRNLDEINCKERKIRKLQIAVFSQHYLEGNTLGTLIEPSQWLYVEPGSVQETLMNLVCGEK